MFDMNYQTNAIMGNQQQMNTYFTNLQNQFTPGYKAETVNFGDLMGQAMAGQAKIKSSGIVFTQGQLVQTQNPTDLAISGNGFFVVSDGARSNYTRDGRLEFRDGFLTHKATGMKVMGYALDANGNPTSQLTPVNLGLDPVTKLYAGRFTNFHFDAAGKMYGDTAMTDPLTKQTVVSSVPIFQVAVGSFANPSGLRKSGTTTFMETENSGQAVVGTPGQGALGIVAPQYLEMSNVDFAQQAAAIGMAKQNYEANFAAFKAMDKMTENAIGLIR